MRIHGQSDATPHRKQKKKSDDEVFSEMMLKSTEKVPDNEEKDELKLEILSLILRARRRPCNSN